MNTFNRHVLKAMCDAVVQDSFNFIARIDDEDIRKMSSPLYSLIQRDEEAKKAAIQYLLLLLTVDTDKPALTKQLQRVLNSAFEGSGWPVNLSVDGKVGPATASAFSSYTHEIMLSVVRQMTEYLSEKLKG